MAPYGWNMSDSLFRTASCCSGLGIDGRLPTCKSMYASSFSPAFQGSADRAGWRSFAAPLSINHDAKKKGWREEDRLFCQSPLRKLHVLNLFRFFRMGASRQQQRQLPDPSLGVQRISIAYNSDCAKRWPCCNKINMRNTCNYDYNTCSERSFVQSTILPTRVLGDTSLALYPCFGRHLY